MLDLKHPIECECPDCYAEFLPIGEQNPTELFAKKLLELAEQEGGLKAFITGELENLPNYNKLCDCEKGINYSQEFKTGEYRTVCLRCGGIMLIHLIADVQKF